MEEYRFRTMASVYLQCQDKILFLYRKGSRVISDAWIGSAGGHFEEGELNSPRTCVLREMKEELGLEEAAICNLELRYISFRKTQAETRINYYFFADLPNGFARKLASNEGDLKWFSLDEAEALEMPFTAKHIIRHYSAVGRKNHVLYIGVAGPEGLVFHELREC